jgi:hypothetical protein
MGDFAYEPHTWMGLVGLIIIGLALVAAAAIPAWIKVVRPLRAVHDQVKNNHDTNLRNDLDDIRDDIREGFAAVHHRMDGFADRLDGFAGRLDSR